MTPIEQDLQNNQLRQQDAAGFNATGSGGAEVAPEIMEALESGTEAEGSDPVTEFMPNLEQEAQPDQSQPQQEQGGGMDLGFLEPELVVSVMDTIIPFIAIIIFGKIYGSDCINKKAIKGEMSFTTKEKNDIEKPLGKWLQSLQVRSPGPFTELLIVLLVILASKSYSVYEMAKVMAESMKEENELKEMEKSLKQAAKLQKTAEKAGFTQTATTSKTKVYDMTPVSRAAKKPAGRPRKEAAPVAGLELPNDIDNEGGNDDLLN